MANGNRMQRVDAEIQKCMANLISRMDDSDIANNMVSIMKVETFADFSLSKIYISALGGLEKKNAIVKKLNDNKKTFRYELAHHLRMRTVPDILFVVDDVTERAEKVLKLFEKIEAEESLKNEGDPDAD